MPLTVITVTPRPATCLTSCFKNRRIPIPAPDQPPLAPWAQDLALDPARAVTAVVPQLAEPRAAEQVSRGTYRLDESVSPLG